MQRFVLFGLFCTLTLYAILRLQSFFPWFFSNFQTTPLSPDLAVNTSINFSTTTTWQAHGGENTMSYFSQMVELCAQNFLAGAAGLAVGIAFIRGLARQLSNALGNFWVDLVRTLLWVLLPTASVGALLLVWQGVPMNFNHYAVVTTLEGSKQVIPQGPVAALEIIKNLGTNTSASGHCGEHQSRTVGADDQHGLAWIYGYFVCLHFVLCEQWEEFCWSQHEHAVLQFDYRIGNDGGQIGPGYPGFGSGGAPREAEKYS